MAFCIAIVSDDLFIKKIVNIMQLLLFTIIFQPHFKSNSKYNEKQNVSIYHNY